MYQDSPHWVGYMGLLENLFVKHPLRIDIAGTVESIHRIDSNTLHECYRTFYHPSNMILFVVGDVEPGTLFPFVAEKSRHGAGSRDRSDAYRVSHVYPREPRAVSRSETRKTMQVATPKLLLGFKEVEVPERGEEFVLHDFASSLALEILFGKSSETYELLYEQGLILDDFGASYGMGAGIGYGLVGGETPEPDRLREILLGRLRKLLDEGIAPEDFERSRRAFLGSFIQGFNSLEYIASHYTYFRFHDFDLFRSVDVLRRLDRNLLEERIRSLLDPANSASFVILPQAR
jgi:predicted Zn-dependent peptidase